MPDEIVTAPEPESAASFIGDAEAILAVSENADAGIKDLVDAYKSTTWDNPDIALQTVEAYATKIREKHPEASNTLSPQETVDIAPVKLTDVSGYIDAWEKQNLEKVKEGKDPYLRAYKDSIEKAIEDTATGAFQQINVEQDSGQFADKTARVVLGALPGVAKALGVEKYLERNLRADSNDTLASAVTSGVGSLLSLPIALPNLAINAYEFGKEEFEKSRAAGASVPRALGAGSVEGVNQALDVILDKIILGSKIKKGAGVIATGVKRALGEGTQEYVQNKISDAASVVGLSKDELDELITDQDKLAFGAGAIVGGAAHIAETAVPGLVSANPFGASPEPDIADQNRADGPVPPPSKEPVRDLGEELGITSIKENTPPRKVGVVGEAVAGGDNVTTVEDASTGAVLPADGAAPIANTDKNELFLGNPDGTVSRVVNGEKKQAHTDAVIVDEETAQKVASLQVASPQDQPVIIQTDDLGRPYINHPQVGPDLVVSEDIVNHDPVMIPQAEGATGHVLQTSSRENELGSVEHAATISVGKSAGVSTVGAQQIKESSIADKLRTSNNLNPQVRELLGLNEDFSTELSYVPNTNNATFQAVNDTFAKFDNNYVAFANDLLNRDYDEISVTEAVAARFAGNALSHKANAIRQENPVAAEQYDILAANLWIAEQKIGTETAQNLQRFSVAPITGDTLLTAVKSDARLLSTVRAAEEMNLSVPQVETAAQENAQLDKIESGLNEREKIISESETAAQERHDAPDKVVATIEKEIQSLDDSTSPEIKSAEEAVKLQDDKTAEVEKRAAELEKEADTIETAQEQASQEIADLTKKVDEIQAKPIEIDNTKVEAVKAKKERVAKPNEAQSVKALEKKLEAAKNKEEKARVRLEITKALNEEKARAARELATIDAEVAAAKEAQRKEHEQAQEQKAAELKAVKEALAKAKQEAAANKKEAIIAKRKHANELRAEQKRLRAEKEAALREAKKKRAEELAETRKAKKEQLAKAKEERNATRKARKEQLEAEREKIRAAKAALNKDREKIQARRERNKKITEAVNRYKEEFNAKLTPETTNRINELVQIVQTQNGLVKKNALNELGRTIAKIRGVELAPGSNPLSTFWQANVLSSIGTNVANITGNFVNPVRQVITDIGNREPNKAGRFIRGWAGEFFSKQTLKDTFIHGPRGELDSRSTDITTEQGLKDLAGGVLTVRETDPVRILQQYFGTGKLGKLLSYPAVTLRMLGAMDAVFSRANRAGRIAREEPSYEEYLDTKASEYGKYVAQARTELQQLERLGVKTPSNFVTMRADELSFAARPDAAQINRAVRKDIFQEEGGARGLIARTGAEVLNRVGAIPLLPGVRQDLNAKGLVSYALGRTNRTVRDNVSIDEIYPLVVKGVSQGKTLLINGEKVQGGTKQLLGSVLNAMTEKQIISLRGDSIRPFKYAVGMFVNTGSQILDLSIECIPGVGYLDKKLGGKWHEYTPDEKQQLYGTQFASTLLTGALVASFVPNMDDEDHAPWYIYGGMRDEKLRKSYEAKGIRPFTLRVGNRTVSYKDIPGLNLIFGGIGEVADSHMVAKRTPGRPLGIGAGFASAGVGALYAASQLSLLKNIGTISDLFALQDTQAANSAFDVVSNMGAGLVPFSGAGRELERFVYGDLSRPKNTLNRMLQNIPFAKFVYGAAGELKPALNMFGEPLRAHVIPGLNRFIGESKNSFELDWALRNGYSFSLPKAGNALTKKQLEGYVEMQQSDDPENFEPYLTEEDQRAYLEKFGPEFRGILGKYASSDPHGYSPDVQRRLDRDIKRAKARVKKEILHGN